MNRKFKIWQPLILAFVMIAGILIGLNLYDQIPKKLGVDKRPVSSLKEVQNILDIIDRRYGIEQAESELKDQLIHSIAESLDPHSAFLKGKKYTTFMDQVKGAYRGIGPNCVA